MKRILLSILILTALIAGCARVPSEKHSQSIVKKYFHKYGHHYKTSDFGTSPVEQVLITKVTEVHKHMVEIYADVKLSDGTVYAVRCLAQKKTLGWRIVTWEKL